MKSIIKLFTHKYGVLGSEEIRLAIVISTTVLQAGVSIMELIVDLPTVEIELVLPFLVLNAVLLWVCLVRRATKSLAHIQLLAMYMHGCLLVFIAPNNFHVVIFWISMVPLIALLVADLTTANLWLFMTFIYILGAGLYFNITLVAYSVTLNYLSYTIIGLIFCLVLAIWIRILKNVFGLSIEAAHLKNREISKLLRRVELMNNKLELKVAKRTKDLKARNQQLEEYAFMNSHLVRAPLANILGLVEYLKDDHSNFRQEELIEMIDISSRQLDEEIKRMASKLAESDNGRRR